MDESFFTVEETTEDAVDDQEEIDDKSKNAEDKSVKAWELSDEFCPDDTFRKQDTNPAEAARDKLVNKVIDANVVHALARFPCEGRRSGH